jgi:hypothetical protein
VSIGIVGVGSGYTKPTHEIVQLAETKAVTKWAKNKYGKSIPVEYKVEGGAEVSLDFAHSL